MPQVKELDKRIRFFYRENRRGSPYGVYFI
jgi:hypothetical protein